MASDLFGNYVADLSYPVPGVSSGGASGQPLAAGNPEGVVIADQGAIIADVNGGLYVKTGAGINAIGWTTEIEPQA